MSTYRRGQALLDRILDVMKDGEPRTLRRIAYLTSISVNTVRRAMNEGLLVKVGERRSTFSGPRGQIVVQIANAPGVIAEVESCKRAAR